MLVLTRRPGEQIVIGNGIRVTVVSVGPGRVKIGIEAPADVRIDRQEVHEKIQQEQAVDVLAAVGRNEHAEEPSPTIVAANDTATRLHNRIADRLPAAPPPNPSAPVPDGAVQHRLSKYRLPRKSR